MERRGPRPGFECPSAIGAGRETPPLCCLSCRGILKGMDHSRWNPTPGQQVVHRSLVLAAETNELCRPIHLLAALAELDGLISDALVSPLGRPLLPRSADPPPVHGGGASYLVMQTQEAATQFASERGKTMNPEHLLLAVIDQGDPEVVEVLDLAVIDLAAVRRAALEMLGAPGDLPPIPMPPLTPAGTLDRPPLPVGELDPRASAALCWRQDHMPLRKIRRRGHYAALRHLESQATWRVSSKLSLDDDQRYSLLRHHVDRIEQLAAQAKPELVELRSSVSQFRVRTGMTRTAGRRRRLRRPRWMNFTVGWGTWFANRQVGLRNRWFRFRTISDFRRAPQL